MSSNWLAPLILAVLCGCTERATEPNSSSLPETDSPRTERADTAQTESKRSEEVVPKAEAEPEKKVSKEIEIAKPRIPTPLDPEIQKLAASLLGAVAAESDKASASLAALKRAAIPYLLEVYLDDEDQPRVSVDKVLNEVLRVAAPHLIDSEAIEVLLDALKHPNAAMRRGAFRTLVDEIIAPKIPEQIFDGLRAAAKADTDARTLRHAKKLLSSTAESLVERMLAPAANPADDDKDFATLISIGSEAMAPLDRGLMDADATFRQGLAAGPDRRVQKRLLRLTTWKLRASTTVATIRFYSSLGN